jgi:hypothetical protein
VVLLDLPVDRKWNSQTYSLFEGLQEDA